MFASKRGKAGSFTRLTKRPLGQVLVDGEFISSEDLENALEQQKHTNELLGELLVRMGMLDQNELKAVLSVQRDLASIKDAIKAAAGLRQLLGELLVQARRVTPEQLESALQEQKQTGEKLGEVLVRKGHLTESGLDAVLSFQQNQGSKSPLSVRFRIGEILVATNIISRDQLEEALAQQKISRKKIGEVLVEAGYVQPHHISYGLKIQRKLITAALVSLVSMATLTGFPEKGSMEAFASSSTKITVTATVQARAIMKVLRRPAELVVTNADVLRGYVEAPVATRFEVKNNSPAGYLLTFDGLSAPVKEVHVHGLGRDVQIGQGVGLVPQPYARGTFMIEISYRFVLSENAQPGTYSWPVSISVSPM